MSTSAHAIQQEASHAIPWPIRAKGPNLLRLVTTFVGTIGFVAMMIALLTHLSTYSVATFIRMPVQQNVSTTVKQQSAQTASQVLTRINQSDLNQYSSQAEHDTWWPSTCSTASLVEVMNSYGRQYKITDVLKVESHIGAITVDSGLLYPDGIDQTAKQFGFTTNTLKDPSLDQIIDMANKGQPVIVNFPPETWPGGHFLVVLGGETIDGTHLVHLADSSKLNMQYMKVGTPSQWGTFLYYWKGLAKVLTPQSGSQATTAANSQYSVIGKPTLSVDFINQVLANYQSPAAGRGQALYDLGVKYQIDPAFALAFFLHESTMGTAGEAQTTLSLGNLRCIPGAACINTDGTACQQNQNCYAAFPTWEAGFEAWYQLIRNLYVRQWNLVTIDQIIPTYAPSSDNNNEQGYISSLKHYLDTWRAGQLRP